MATIRLEAGSSVDESGIEEAYFDVAHQSFLFLRDGQVSRWTPNGGMEMVRDLGERHRKKSTTRQEILYAKVSLDHGFLVLQYSETSLRVLDLRVPSQQWNLEIKSAYDNRIIEEGLIWSQHGGGSEDLIIVTARGAEMYKISSKRNQCKLSRVLNQGYDYHARFWYEPNHRVLLLASPLISLDTTNTGGFMGFFTSSNKAEEQKKVLLQDLGTLALNGYFFRIDKDHVMPKLELPPPEKTPKWEVGPRVHESDVCMVALYGSVYCVVHIRKAPEYHLEGELHLYRLTASSSTHTHTLVLDYPAPQIPPLGTSLAFSVVDNLLVVHCKRLRVSAVFEVITPHDGSSGIADDVETSDTRGVALKTMRADRQTKAASSAPLSLAPLAPPATIIREDTDAASINEGRGPGEEYYHQAHEDSVLMSHEEHLQRSKRTTKQMQEADIYDDGEDDPRFCRWQLLLPHWVWDRKLRTLHALRPCIGPLLAAMGHRLPSVYTEFLLRRGGTLRAPRAVYNDLQGEAQHRVRVAVTAKQLLMHKVGESLELTKNLTYLQALFMAICAPYARVQRAVGDSRLQEEQDDASVDSRLRSSSGPNLSSLSPAPAPAPALAQRAAGDDGVGASEGDAPLPIPPTGEGQNDGAPPHDEDDDEDEEAPSAAFDDEVVGLDAPSPVRGQKDALEGTNDGDGDGEGLLEGLISSARESVVNSPALEGIHHLVSEAQVLYVSKIQPYTAAVGELIGVRASKAVEAEGSLEPVNSLQIFLPDLSAVTASTLRGLKQGVRKEGASQGTNSAGLHVSVPRDAYGMLAITQAELLSLLWFPLVLINTQGVSSDYASYALTLYLGALRAAGATALPCACLLLIRLLSAQGKFLEIARLMQLQYFLDSSEVALTCLEACDILQQEDARSYRQHLPTMRTLQQAALDMLWRLHERNTVVRWLCSHGRISEAMKLCQRRRGAWRRGLSPSTVSGCDFYNGALLQVQSTRREHGSGDGDGDGDGGFSLSYPRRLGICFAVYRFLLSWEPSLLLPSSKGKSQLASMSAFPAGFRDRDELQLRGLFGFPVSEDLINRVTGIPAE